MQTGSQSKTRLVEQIKAVLRSGEYSRALDLLRSAAAQSGGDPELFELEKQAQEGVKRKAEADRLITESQELFARQKSGEAIQRLRTAYELDKTNSLARTILANALVEHAQSIVETDWLEAEKLSNQALALNPAHPTAKTILNIIVQKKETSPVDEWVSQANKLHSSGDLFAALAWVAEGLAVHPHDPKLLQVQEAVQRDQEVRRRQARRGDLDELRRLQQEIAGAADGPAKQALVVRIQTVAAKHWTDGEILSIANALLLRLGLVPQESSTAAQRRKGGTVIFHVPRASASKPGNADALPVPASTVANTEAEADPAPTSAIPSGTAAAAVAAAPAKIQTSTVKAERVPRTPAKKRAAPHRTAKDPAAEPAAATAKVASPHAAEVRPIANTATPAVRSDDSGSKSTLVIVFSAVAVIALAVVLFFAFARKHPSQEAAKTPVAAPDVSTPAASAPAVVTPDIAAPEPAPADTTPETSQPVASDSPDAIGKVATDNQPAHQPGRDAGTLVVIVGQNDARVTLNGKPQRQLTRGGQLKIPNLDVKDYVVQVSKNGFQDPAQQQIRIRKGEEAKLTFNLQPLPRMASLAIQGGAPGTTVFIDQKAMGTVQTDGTLNVAGVNPGDHVVELRKERFKSRQFKKHFVAGSATSLAGAESALEAAGGELKITFSPPDAKVALVKGDFLKIVSSGVPLSLDAGTYTLTARTAERFTRSGTVDVVSGQSKTLDLALSPNGMSKWADAAGWKHEGDSFTRKGGDFVLYGVVPTAGTFAFSAIATKGHLLQWVLNYSDPRNYILFQLDENGFHRTVIRNGEKRDEIIVPHKGDKKNFRTVQIRVSASEIVHQLKDGDSWAVLDRLTLPGVNLSAGKFGFYIPGNDQVAISSFAQYADLNIR